MLVILGSKHLYTSRKISKSQYNIGIFFWYSLGIPPKKQVLFGNCLNSRSSILCLLILTFGSPQGWIDKKSAFSFWFDCSLQSHLSPSILWSVSVSVHWHGALPCVAGTLSLRPTSSRLPYQQVPDTTLCSSNEMNSHET